MIGAAIGLVVALIGINAYGDWYIAHLRGHDPEPAPSTVGLPFEDVRYGDNLPAWYIPGEAAKPSLVVVHGAGGNRSSALDVAPGLHGRGYPLLLIELGYDTGRVSFGGGQREVNDVRAAAAWLHEHGHTPVVLLGYSLGGFIVCAAAVKGVDAVAVISDSGFTSFQSNSVDHSGIPRPVFWLMPVLFPLVSGGGHMIDVTASVPAGYHLPTLIIQGTADTDSRPHEGQDLAMALHGELWLLPGVGHTAAYDANPTEYLDHLDRFISTATHS